MTALRASRIALSGGAQTYTTTFSSLRVLYHRARRSGQQRGYVLYLLLVLDGVYIPVIFLAPTLCMLLIDFEQRERLLFFFLRHVVVLYPAFVLAHKRNRYRERGVALFFSFFF